MRVYHAGPQNRCETRTPKDGPKATPASKLLVNKNGTSCASTPPADLVDHAALRQGGRREASDQR
jgi:hypothetical protein